MHHNILIPKQEHKASIEGHCIGFQTDLDFVYDRSGILIPVDTKKVVKGTKFRKKNTISSNLINHLAYRIASNSEDKALDSLFTQQGSKASVGVAMDSGDGMVHGIAGNTVTYILLTVLNTGGTGAEAYAEWYGYIDGACTLDTQLSLGHDYDDTGNGKLTTRFSTVNIDQTVAANRRYHHYWKFTLSIT